METLSKETCVRTKKTYVCTKETDVYKQSPVVETPSKETYVCMYQSQKKHMYTSQRSMKKPKRAMYVLKRPMHTSKRNDIETPSNETHVCTNVKRNICIRYRDL